MSAIEILEASLDDVGAVTECVCAAYLRYVRRIGRQPRPMLEDYSAHIRDHLVYKANSGETLVGAMVLYETDLGFYLDNIAVSPDFSGQGIGREMLNFAEGIARQLGHAWIYLATNVLMVENQLIYQRVGYVEFAREVVNGYSLIYYRKALHAATPHRLSRPEKSPPHRAN